MGDVKLRRFRYAVLQSMLTTLQAVDEDTVTEDDVKTHFTLLSSNWTKLNQAHENILGVSDAADLPTQFTVYEHMVECHSKILTILHRLQSKTNIHMTPQPTQNLNLPNMSLPSFDGKYDDWHTFANPFKANIHNNSSLSSSHKLQYLKSCLQGDAANTVKSITSADANFSEAWRLLKSQYDNKCEIITSHLKHLLFQSPLNHESAASLQELLNKSLESRHSLKLLEQETAKWDAVLVVILVEKFDSATKAEWARSLKGISPPTFAELQDFIIQHIRTLHAKGSSQQSLAKVSVHNSASATRAIHTHHATVQPSCQHCRGGHQLFQCNILKNMTPDKRHDVVKSLHKCLNCLRDGHSYKECRSASRCRLCNKPHNTFLHFDQPPLPSHPQPTHSSINQHSSNNHQHSVIQQNASSAHLQTGQQSSSKQQQSVNQQIASSHLLTVVASSISILSLSRMYHHHSQQLFNRAVASSSNLSISRVHHHIR